MHWLPKRLIEQWIEQQTWNGSELLQPNHCIELVQEKYPIEENEVFEYLLNLVKDGQLIARTFVYCQYEDAHKAEILYQKDSVKDANGNVLIDVSDILDKKITCPACKRIITADYTEIKLGFVPSSEYKKILNAERLSQKKRFSLLD